MQNDDPAPDGPAARLEKFIEWLERNGHIAMGGDVACAALADIRTLGVPSPGPTGTAGEPSTGNRYDPCPAGCPAADAWRCAVARNLTSVSCPCDCHRRPLPGIVGAAAGAAPASPAVDWKLRYEEEAAAHRLAHTQWLEVMAERDALRASPAVREAAVKNFTYLLNAMELAAQYENPAEHGYAAKRKAVLDFVAALAADGERPA